MASLTGWTWVWANSQIWWWIGKPGMLQSVGLQKFGCDWTERTEKWLRNPTKMETVPIYIFFSTYIFNEYNTVAIFLLLAFVNSGFQEIFTFHYITKFIYTRLWLYYSLAVLMSIWFIVKSTVFIINIRNLCFIYLFDQYF